MYKSMQQYYYDRTVKMGFFYQNMINVSKAQLNKAAQKDKTEK